MAPLSLPTAPGPDTERGSLVINLGRGPVTVSVPSSYHAGTPAPLVLLLHGYGANGDGQEAYMQFAPWSEQYGFIYAHPDGSFDFSGNRFWNATDACCDFYHLGVDDSGYLLALINAIKQALDVDSRRVFLIGHSNGGFMSYRMACDHSGTIAAIASLAGATYFNPSDCSPDSPVHVLQIHGTADSTVLYNGGVFGGIPYPGAVATTEQWAGFGGCSLVPDFSAPPIDLDASIPGNETLVRRYRTGCFAGGSGELWSIQNGSHIPNLASSFGRLVVEWLLAHPKPASSDVTNDFAPAREMRAFPNPFRESIELAFDLRDDARISVDVINAAGQKERTLTSSAAMVAGEHVVRWDGRSDTGDRVAPGLYFVRVSGGGTTRATKLIRME